METVKYELRSKPRVTVDVPAEFASQAQEAVDIVRDPMKFLCEAYMAHPAFRNPGIAKTAADLVQALPEPEEALKLQDILYLRTVIFGSESKQRWAKPSTEPEKQEAAQKWILEQNLCKVVRELETEIKM